MTPSSPPLRIAFQGLVDREYDGLCAYAAWLTGGVAPRDTGRSRTGNSDATGA